MRTPSARLFALSLGAAGLFWAGAAQAAAEKTIIIGMQCDRTGPTQIVGTALCPGIHDYIDLINSRGGIDGWKIQVNEIDHEYKVPPAVEECERAKQQGAPLVAMSGAFPGIYSDSSLV